MNELTNPKPLDEDIEKKNSIEQGGDVEETVASEIQENEEAPVSEENVETQSTEEITDIPESVEAEIVTADAEVPQPNGPESEYRTLEELDKLEQEYSEQEFETMSKLYEETLADFKSGQVVVGKVLAINDKEVSVDIGFKSEGSIPLEEFPNIEDVVIGDNIEVYIDEIEDVDGYLVLSKKKADFMRIWEKVIQSYETGDILTGKCTRRIKGGIVVDLGGVDAFLPGSQIDVRPIRDFDALIGKDMDFKIVKVNHLRKNIVVSHRVLVEQEMKGQREKILEDLERGQILDGIVKNITDFGVFIDLGGVDGLLHINDLSWGRVSHPSEVVALDEKIQVVVLDYNEAKDRISLGLKQLQPHPWEDVETKYPVGSVVRGKVVSISDYGAFVELEKGVEGLIHISEMSWTQHIKHPSKILAVGEHVEAKVLNIQKDERKISLGLKQLEPDPWESLAERYPVGSIHTGKVRNLTNFGAFVELEEGIDGLVHISDLSWTKKIRHPGEVVKKGDEIKVVVLNVDRNNRRISLGYKQTQDNPWDYFEERYKPGMEVEGKVVRLIEKGLLAELPDGVDGFVPMSQLAKEKLTKPADGYQIDDIITLTVLEFNKENKKIVLSEKSGRAPQPASSEKKAAEDEVAEDATAEETPKQDVVDVPVTETADEQPAEGAEKTTKVPEEQKDESVTEETVSTEPEKAQGDGEASEIKDAEQEPEQAAAEESVEAETAETVAQAPAQEETPVEVEEDNVGEAPVEPEAEQTAEEKKSESAEIAEDSVEADAAEKEDTQDEETKEPESK
ncbi:MAG: 30S ribosomal protein S1 [Actinobacteria bacterium]|nr:30S ribosomal protein S1 [Actinomycetota bacterium]